MKHFYLLVGIWLVASSLSWAQEHTAAESAARGYIIQLHPEVPLRKWTGMDQLRREFPFQLSKVISAGYKVLLLEHRSGITDHYLLEALRSHPDIQAAQLNYPVYLRNQEPTDPFWEVQWNLERIGLNDVWASSNYGHTQQGIPIVLGILEPNGYDTNHEDLYQQIWLNEAEIPLDGEDNDGNNFVDDFMGWNAGAGNDNHQGGEAHGTQVAGIASATVNNERGVSSVGWNSRLLLLSGNRYVDQVIENYYYALELRKRFNESGGQEGALIVATNASFGTSGDPRDFPIWCEIYDRLGAEGILSVAAADNRRINTDLRSDIPTSCSSEYLITVTGVDRFDQFLSGKAFGPETVDIAAPAEGILTTYPGDQYLEIQGGGNSFAAPHVTGAIGLLYSLPYARIQEGAMQEPAATALMMKSFLMNGAQKLSSLSGMIKSEGRLDLAQSSHLVQGHFEAQEDRLKIEAVYPVPFRRGISVLLYGPEPGSILLEVRNLQGQSLYRMDYEAMYAGNHQLQLPLDHLPPGMYTLLARTGKSLSSAKLVKLRR